MNVRIEQLLDLSHTRAAGLFHGKTFPWEVLGEIGACILTIGEGLDQETFDNPREGVWIAKDARIYPSAYIEGPCIIESGAEVRHGAFIRGGALVGKHCVVGNSTELKNAILFNGVQAPHYNYIGDSILGYKAHMGAGAIASNLKSDKSLVVVKSPDGELQTGLKKFGVILGDYVEIGANAVLNPGTVVGRHSSVYPASCVRGVVPENSICKNSGEIHCKF